jgi:hypothetical protein
LSQLSRCRCLFAFTFQQPEDTVAASASAWWAQPATEAMSLTFVTSTVSGLTLKDLSTISPDENQQVRIITPCVVL